MLVDISDIGASGLKPLFIAICSVTALGLALSLALERWLRHAGRLLPNMRRRERVFAGLAIIGGTMGGVCLILLSVFDTARHETAHRVFLVWGACARWERYTNKLLAIFYAWSCLVCYIYDIRGNALEEFFSLVKY